MNKESMRKLAEAVEYLDLARLALFECSGLFMEDDDYDLDGSKKMFRFASEVELIKRSLTLAQNGRGKDESEPVRSRVTSESTAKRRSRYPMFEVRNDQLVKIGLRRNRKEIYEHLVSRFEFDEIVRHIQGLHGSEFTADEVLRLTDIPSYKTYLILSLLSDKGFVVSPKRGAYFLQTETPDELHPDRVWDQVQ